MIDRGATSFHVAGDVLLALGGSWDEAAERATGIGLAAYGFDGRKQFQLFDGELAWLAQFYGERAYVGISGQETLRVVDLATGSVVATRPQPLPWLLLGEHQKLKQSRRSLMSWRASRGGAGGAPGAW